ncbi:MAG: DUF4406 domain-containing protein [Oscillospiraceae bacterium]|nr:DUF4406 domain-containing protein [Oscillospiraceae bacterium]
MDGRYGDKAIYLLPDWRDSPGAVREAQYAFSMGYPLVDDAGEHKHWVPDKGGTGKERDNGTKRL